ncbi:MAG: GNAT family N-acetyltransferase [Dehalococcoidia bacterium]|nr:GNAT family N-acetyltransferase [Dehalococcoidia bacterium]
MFAMDFHIEPIQASDLDRIVELLSAAGLPVEGVVGGQLDELLVARHVVCVIGAVGLERHGDYGLLRSLIVAVEHRGRGDGQALTEAVLKSASEKDKVFLLTQTAADYFLRFGFRAIPREEAEGAVGASLEFRFACCESAVAMVRERPDELWLTRHLALRPQGRATS